MISSAIKGMVDVLFHGLQTLKAEQRPQLPLKLSQPFLARFGSIFCVKVANWPYSGKFVLYPLKSKAKKGYGSLAF